MSPTTQEFGSLDVGTASPSFTFTVTNSGQASSGAISATLAGTDAAMFKIGTNGCTTLEGGKTCSVSVSFTATSGGAKSATLTVAGEPGGTVTATLTGTGKAIVVDPAALQVSSGLQDFGSVSIGTSSQTVSFTVSNTGGAPSGAASVTIGGADAAQFSLASNGCTSAIAPAGSCSFSVRFTPTTVGVKAATITIAATPGGPLSVTLAGTGTGMSGISISPSPSNFGSVVIGASSPDATFTVTNTGTVPTAALTAMISGTNATQFALGTNGCTTLAAGASCTIAARFSPTSSGGFTASLDVTDGTAGNRASAALAGTGITASSLSISPASSDFGNQVTGTMSAPVVFTVRNNGGTPSAALTSVLGGADSGSFTLAGDNCAGSPLAAGATCTVNVRFGPTTTGAKTATLTVSGAIATLTGAGIAAAGLSISPTPQAFGNVAVGSSSAAFTFTVTNTGGTATPALLTSLGGDTTEFQFVSGGNGCAGATLAAAGTCTISLTFNPTTAGAKAASLNVNGGAAGIASAALNGTGINPANLIANVASQDFGTVAIGSVSSNAVITITNNGGQTSGTPTVQISGTNSGQFTKIADTCTAALAAAATCQITMAFAPTTTAGAKTASLDVSATPGNTVSVALNGNAQTAAALAVLPTPQAFGSLIAGLTSAPITFTVTNSGAQTTGPLALSFTGTDASQWAITAPVSGNCFTGVTTLATGASCTVVVTFQPTSAGAKVANLSIAGTPGGTALSSISGTGLNQFVLTAPIVAPATVVSPYLFGSRAIGSTTTQAITWRNNGLAASPALTAPVLAGADASQFLISANTCLGIRAAGSTCQVTVQFKPLTGGAKTATVSLAGFGVGQADVLTVTGTGTGQLAFTVGALGTPPAAGFTAAGGYDFGNVLVGASRQSTSTGGAFVVTCATVVGGCGMVTTNLTGLTTEYAVLSDTCAGTILGSGGTCNINVIFYPASVAAGKNATLSISSQANPLDTATMAITGAGTPSQTLTVTGTAAFGVVGIGDNATNTFTVTNAAAAPTTSVLNIAVNNTTGAGFTRVAPITGECGFAGFTTLPAGGSCTIRVRLAPLLTNGAYAANLTVQAGTGAPVTITTALTGTGQSRLILTPEPGGHDFGSIQQQSTSPNFDFTLTNQGTSTTGSMTRTLTGAAGDISQYNIVTHNCPVGGLPAAATCTITVNFAPTLAHLIGVMPAVSLRVQDLGTAGRNATAPLNGTVTPGASQTFTRAPISQDFGSQAIGQSPGSNPVTFTFTNAGDYATGVITRTATGANAADFLFVSDTCNGVALAARSTCTVVVRFYPATGATGNRVGTLTWTPAASTPATPGAASLAVNGQAVAVGLLVTSPSPDTFGNVVVGATATRQYTLTNTSASAWAQRLRCNQVGFPNCPGTPGGVFTYIAPAAGTACGYAPTITVIPAGMSCSFAVVFSPLAAGLQSVRAFEDQFPNPYGVISGTGLTNANLTLSASANFGNVATGQTTKQTLTVTNIGQVTSGAITAVLSGPDSTSYTVTASTCTTLAPAATCTFDVNFAPTTQSVKNATLTVSGTPGGTIARALVGTGTQPPALALSPSAPVVMPAVVIGNSLTTTFTVSNPAGAVTSSAITATLTGTDFAIDTALSTCVVVAPATMTLAGGASCTYVVRFTPTGAPGARGPATLTVSAALGATPALVNTATSTANSALTVNTPAPALTAVAQVGTTSGGTATVLLTFTNNAGVATGPLTTVLTGAMYSITTNSCANNTLGAGGTCQVRVRYQPTAVGVTTGTLVVTGVNAGTGAAGNSATSTITGTGT